MVTDPSIGIKHAFVTGATGMVGVALCRQLRQLNIRVTSYSRSSVTSALPAGVVHVVGDILDQSSMQQAAEGVDVIFHLAAAVHGSVSTAADFMNMNVGGTRSAVLTAQAIGAKLVLVSTVNAVGYEQHTLKDPYAESKAKAEDVVLDAVENGLSATIVRPATVFGNEQGSAGLVVERLLSGSLKILPAGGRKISPVWSGDLATALRRAGEVGEPGRIYTVAGKTVTTRDFVNSICDSVGLRRPLFSPPAWLFVAPLQIAWWLSKVTRLTPAISIESLLNHSSHDGSAAALSLGFSYTTIPDIFETKLPTI
jgi:nucleoside-diphosphate-sugar epimerase